jgi:hypothetical protein
MENKNRNATTLVGSCSRVGSWGLKMKGTDGRWEDTESSFFYAKDQGEYERKSDMKLHARCLSREIGDLLQRKGDYAQAPEEECVVIPLCEIQTLVPSCMTHENE